MSTYQMFTSEGLEYTNPNVLLTRIREMDTKFDKIKKGELKGSLTQMYLYELFGIFYLTQNLKDSFKDISGEIENPYIEVYNYILQLSNELMFEFFAQDREGLQAFYRAYNGFPKGTNEDEMH